MATRVLHVMSSTRLIRSRGLLVSGSETGTHCNRLNYSQCSQAFPLIGRHILMSPHLQRASFPSILMSFLRFLFPASPCSRSRRAPRPVRICPSAYHACYPSPSRRVTTTTTTTTTCSAAVRAPAATTTTAAKRARRRSYCSRRTTTWPISWPPASPTRHTEAPQHYTRIRISIPQRPAVMCYVYRPRERRSPGHYRHCITRRWHIRRSRIGWQVSE